ncbi:MAG: hypothetical protein NVS2B6_03540 [Thermoleophilaceae bacterium]
MRGYDRQAVDEYVERMNGLVTELRATHTTDAAVKEALDQVGEETSGILQRAHETADQITSTADAAARARLDEANREADRVCADAEARARALESDTRALWDERGALIEDTRRLAETLLDAADSAAERMPERDAQSSSIVAVDDRFDAEEIADAEGEDHPPRPSILEAELANREESGGRVLHGVAPPPPPAAGKPPAPPRSMTPPPPPPPPPAAAYLDRPTEAMDVLAFVEREQGASARFKASQAADFMSRWRR